MKRLNVLIVLFACSLAASAETLKGVVSNGTVKKPAAGDEVLLKKPGQGGMEDAGKTVTNAKGEFSFKLTDQRSPYVLWIKHNDVLYSEVVRPGTNSVAVQVYDAAAQLDGVERVDDSYVIQAEPNAVQVTELFSVKNTSNPPRSQPNFEIYLPEGAKIVEGSASQQGGMPLRRAPVPQQEKNKYVFQYPVRPGETHFDVTYNLPYTGKLKFEPKLTGPLGKLFVVMPKSIHFSAVSGAPFEHVGEWEHAPGVKDVDVQQAKNLQAGAQVAFEIEGTGTFPEENAQQQQGGQTGNSRRSEENRPGGGLGVPNEKPNPISSGQWAFLGVLTLFLSGGAVLVFFTNRQQESGDPQAGSAVLLNALKEEMFQLESDRAQGRISQQEYSAAKNALDKTLQRVVKRNKKTAVTAT